MRRSKKILVEFDGLAFHPDTMLCEKELIGWRTPFGVSGVEVRKNDMYKTKLALKNDFRLIRINETVEVNNFITQIKDMINEN